MLTEHILVEELGGRWRCILDAMLAHQFAHVLAEYDEMLVPSFQTWLCRNP